MDGATLAPINYKDVGVEEVTGTRGTPTCTTTVCAKPPNTDEQPVVIVREEDAVYVDGAALAAIKYKYVGVEEVAT